MERLVVLACRFLIWAKPAKVITGMALGWDTAVALACVRCNVPFIAAIPFEGQDYTWPHDARSRYKTLRRWAAEEVIVSLGGYTPGLMHARNRWMVDRCEAVMAVWNGSPVGGTAQCLNYAKQIQRPVVNLWVDFVASLA